MVRLNNEIYVVRKGCELNEDAKLWLSSGNAIAYVLRQDRKFFDGKGRFMYDFRNSWESLNPEKLEELDIYIKDEFYKPNPTSHIAVNETLIEFDHFWEERKKIHKKMLEKLVEGEMVIDHYNEI